MPVTAKLSKLFYERLGEQIANELVDWFNQVDATYRSDLRETNDLNWSRFEAKLEQRLAELKAELKTEFGERFARIEARLETFATKADLALLKADLEKGLREQTRLALFLWVTLLAVILAK